MPEKKSSKQTSKTRNTPRSGKYTSKVRTGNFKNIKGHVNIAGRDIINNITNLQQRGLTPGEITENDLQLEVNELAHGVDRYLEWLKSQVLSGNSTNPYKGLEAYTLSDTDSFFGREEAVQELYEISQNGKLTILQAESGTGKTSLLQAGLFPKLIHEGHLAVFVRPQFENPTLTIKQKFIGDLNLTPKLADTPLANFLRKVSEIIGIKTTLYLILDQFEEFFNRQTLDEDRQFFIHDLADCLNEDTLNIRWIISITTDTFGQLGKFEPHIRNPFSNAKLLYLLGSDEAAEVITKSARKHHLSFEKGLLEQMLGDLGQKQNVPIAPTQIQLVCSALYDELKPKDKIFSHSLYRNKGGAEGILHGYIGNVLRNHLPLEERIPAYKILEELVSSEKKRIIRRKPDLETALEKTGISPAVTESTLEHLVNQRLLRRLGDLSETVQYEIVHDYLLGEIEINEEIQKIKEADELLEQGIKRWEKPEKMLLSPDEVRYLEGIKSKPHYSDTQLKLLIMSAANYSRPFRYWLGKLDKVEKSRFAITMSSALERGNRKDKRIARKVLITLGTDAPGKSLIKAYIWYFARYSLLLGVLLLITYFIYTPLTRFLGTPETSGWQHISSFTDQTGITANKLSLALDPLNPDLIFAADPNGKGLFGTTDGGLEWTPIGDKAFKGQSIKNVAVVSGMVYAITDRQVYLSTDGGLVWAETNSPLTGSGESLSAIALNLYSANEVFTGSSRGKIYFSADRGNSWSEFPSEGMAGSEMRALAINNKQLLAATDRGVWMYLWDKARWQEIPLRQCIKNGNESSHITALAIPRAIYSANETDFIASIQNQGLCSSDTKGEYDSIYIDQPATTIFSMAIAGDLNGFDAQAYLSTDSGMYCIRVWDRSDRAWWYKKINQYFHLQFELPCLEESSS